MLMTGKGTSDQGVVEGGILQREREFEESVKAVNIFSKVVHIGLIVFQTLPII